MKPHLGAGGAFAVAALLTSIGIAGAHAAIGMQSVPNGRQAPTDFDARVRAYLALRSRVDNDAPKRQQTSDVNKLQDSQRTLAVLIRNARAGAKQADVFGPGIPEKFRALLKPELRGADGAATRASMDDEKATVELKVNGDYPANQPLASVPPDVLQALPPLPKNEDLEYRFVGQHLILLDTRANLIIDFVFNALP